ncbi:MAG: hydrogenase nickel incorporation protein HypB [Lachnospiraceae bacterium]|nr:hydrogenase nickel incorporation protein HypB [Lachnospiraceae bacterium]MBR0154225.1 hydrogenase nickel incorporation protein HypB [Lachnospiraceae bacterium]
MDEVRVIEVKRSIFEDNNRDADRLREELRESKTYLINLMSSPGSGKTTTLLALAKRLAGRMRLGVMEADIDSDVDARTIQEAGIPAIQIHTGGMCHLDADMTRQGLREFGTQDLDVVVLENVGNLVCPAEFDAGASVNITILSVPEGDDKPLKYPLMYETCSLLLVNKIDVAEYFDFDREKVVKYAKMRNPDIDILFVSARTGEGIDEAADWIVSHAKQWLGHE